MTLIDPRCPKCGSHTVLVIPAKGDAEAVERCPNCGALILVDNCIPPRQQAQNTLYTAGKQPEVPFSWFNLPTPTA